ncbi:hypothetical protein ADL35_09465 [Streptomyces sp. NRRL WC-3753]|nr:hypothetical protein ADL35_09465 [Streptomyces sp. NRRL WC-3753]
MISVLFAVLTAISNGSASVLQRRAAMEVPDSEAMRLSLMTRLVRQKVWLAGIGLVIVAAVCQAVALATGGWWLWEAHGLQNRARQGTTGAKLKEMRLFHWSITYVSLLFVAVAVDPFLR